MQYTFRSSKRDNHCVLSPVEVRERNKMHKAGSPVDRKSTVRVDVLQWLG